MNRKVGEEAWPSVPKTRRDMEAAVGSVRDHFGPRASVLSDGPMRGMRAVDITNGDGVEATILADRAGDIYSLRWQGRELGFFGSPGAGSAAHYDPHGEGWLRTFSGFMVTCGLTNVGRDPEEPMHGRVAHAPADSFSAESTWEGDSYVTRVRVDCREAAVFGPSLERARTWEVVAGKPEVGMTDIVRNNGFRPEPLLLLYHLNCGHPLLSPATRVDFDADPQPRDAVSSAGLAKSGRIEAPRPGLPEEAYFFRGASSARVVNPALDLALTIRWKADQLPFATEWKDMAAGIYALGIEPGTCHPLGRAAILEAGQGIVLEPGEAHRVDLSFSIASGESQAAASG